MYSEKYNQAGPLFKTPKSDQFVFHSLDHVNLFLSHGSNDAGFFLFQLTEGLNYYDFDLFFGKLQASQERTVCPE